MNFSVLTPLAPRTWVPLFGGVGCWGGGGGKTSLCILGAVCRFGATFFLYMDPLTHGGDPGSELRVAAVAPPPPPGPLLVRT